MFYFKEIFKIGEKEYLNSVVGMQLNGEYVAAYMGNQLQLHSVIIFYIFYDLQVELNQFKKIFNQSYLKQLMKIENQFYFHHKTITMEKLLVFL